MAGVVSALTGKGVRLSASTLSLFERCGRRWWFEKIAGRPRDTSPAMAFGSSVHDVLETYLRGDPGRGVDWATRAGRVARVGLDNLPPPGSVNVEQVVGEFCGPLPFSGRVDWYPLVPGDAPSVVYRPDVAGLYVGDHKTTSDLRWAKTPGALATDTQAHAYVWKILGPDGLDLRLARSTPIGITHVYYTTKGAPRSLRVDAVTTWGDVEASWLERYLPAAIAMRALAAVVEPDHVPANPGDCRSFYRLCPHAGVCSASPENIARRASSLVGLL